MKDNDYTDKQLQKALREIQKIFGGSESSYRIIGSVLVAALNNSPHRKIGDVDLIVDRNDIDRIMHDLKVDGYVIVPKNMYGVRWFEAHRSGSLGFTFLLIGEFKKDYLSCVLHNSLELRISNDYIKPTPYVLCGIPFTGIPLRSIYEGLKISWLNPKRRIDRIVVEKEMHGTLPNGLSLESAFHIFFHGIELPHAYVIFSWFYNIYGGMRVRFGKKYEVWN